MKSKSKRIAILVSVLAVGAVAGTVASTTTNPSLTSTTIYQLLTPPVIGDDLTVTCTFIDVYRDPRYGAVTAKWTCEANDQQ